MKHTEFTELADRLRSAARGYFDTEAVSMTDAEYDDAIEQLKIAAAAEPAWAPQIDDLLNAIAAGQSAGGDVTHPAPMLSMAKANSLATVEAFLAKVGGKVVIEPKLDGLAVRAVYRAGELVQIVTRGDGHSGEDVIGRAASIQGLPSRVEASASFEARGEVIITDADFPIANENRVAAGKEPFINQRNAVAGSLRNADDEYLVPMTFAAYDVADDGVGGVGLNSASHIERMTRLRDLGVTTTESLTPLAGVLTDHVEAIARIEAFNETRADLGFPIDGVIVKADADEVRHRLGEGNQSPHWAIAYKFAAETATTVVREIEASVGRTGRLALRARVDPVFVGGATVTYASLHNASWLMERDIRVGDTVIIKRANDVIPYIESAILAERPADSVAWVPPETDPVGNSWDKTTLLWRSTSPELSVLGRIVYACSRDCLDIEGVGVEVATALVDPAPEGVDDVDVAPQEPLVADIADLFALSLEDLTDLTMAGRRLGAKSAEKIIAEIEKARSAPLNRVITALGIRMTGRTMGRRLAAAFGTMDRLQAASPDELARVDGFGAIRAKVVHDGLKEMAPVIAKLAAAGVAMGTGPGELDRGELDLGNTGKPGDSGKPCGSDDPNSLSAEVALVPADPGATGAAKALAGMTVVVTGAMTGALEDLTRNEMNELIETSGGKSSGSVSKNTSLLVSGQPGSSKYRKAEELGIRIVTPEEFAAMIASE